MGVAVIGLVGGLLGTIVGAAAAYFFSERSRANTESKLIVVNYLVQLQDALESLWFRVDNLAQNSGKAAMVNDAYYQQSSASVLGTAIGQKRRMTLDGVYGHLEARPNGVGRELEKRLESIENQLGVLADHAFQRFYRRELGDMMLDWSQSPLRPVGYSAFVAQLADETRGDLVEAVHRVVESCQTRAAAKPLLDAVFHAAELVSQETGIALAEPMSRIGDGQS